MRHLPLAAFALAVAASASLMFRPTPLLVDRPFTEAGFYVPSIARRAGAGHGFTIDGPVAEAGLLRLYRRLPS